MTSLCGKILLHRLRRRYPIKQREHSNQWWQVELFVIYYIPMYLFTSYELSRTRYVSVNLHSLFPTLSLFRLSNFPHSVNLCAISCPSFASLRASAHYLLSATLLSQWYTFAHRQQSAGPLSSPVTPQLIPFISFIPGHLNIKTTYSKYQHQLEYNDRQFLPDTFPRPKLEPTLDVFRRMQPVSF